jgi:hypothetical protein
MGGGAQGFSGHDGFVIDVFLVFATSKGGRLWRKPGSKGR